jgi:hypothetical protein
MDKARGWKVCRTHVSGRLTPLVLQTSHMNVFSRNEIWTVEFLLRTLWSFGECLTEWDKIRFEFTGCALFLFFLPLLSFWRQISARP